MPYNIMCYVQSNGNARVRMRRYEKGACTFAASAQNEDGETETIATALYLYCYTRNMQR